VIRLQGVSKAFRLPHRGRHTFFHRIVAGEGVSYETFYALRDVNLTIDKGTIVGLIGHNGSGKSTLLRIIAGIYPPTTGTVEVDGPVAPVLDLGVGFHGALPVRDNVVLYGVLLGLSRRRLKDEAEAILERAGVSRFADARLDDLSTGMRARLAYTIAMRVEAPVVLVDETLSVGDAEFQARCLDDLRALRAQGRTAVLVSHEPHLLEAICDRLIVLNGGVVTAEGNPTAMLAVYATQPR
jgi:ABC-type polysaccharide/polyol phosphate transport system ATPase subunit